MRYLLRAMLLSLLLVTGVAMTAPLAEACPSCKTALDERGADSARPYSEATNYQIAEGFAWSIPLLLAAAALLLSGAGLTLWYHTKRAGVPGADAASDVEKQA